MSIKVKLSGLKSNNTEIEVYILYIIHMYKHSVLAKIQVKRRNDKTGVSPVLPASWLGDSQATKGISWRKITCPEPLAMRGGGYRPLLTIKLLQRKGFRFSPWTA